MQKYQFRVFTELGIRNLHAGFHVEMIKRNAKVTDDDTHGPMLAEHLSALLAHYGAQNWWPAHSRFEVIVGAYLTQNTSWRNVELTMINLRRARVLSLKGVRSLPLSELEQLIRPSGYYRQKARRLKVFVKFLDEEYGGSLRRMFGANTEQLRGELLSLEGVGPETADSILLYAGGHSVFVVDAYTRRIFDSERHGVIPNIRSLSYEQLRSVLEGSVDKRMTLDRRFLDEARNPRHSSSRMSRRKASPSARLFNELHAAIVRVGNEHCRKLPNCAGCPLESFLPKNATLSAWD
jgi:endonuclease-3 related protein